MKKQVKKNKQLIGPESSPVKKMHPLYVELLARLIDSMIVIVDSGRDGGKTTLVAQHAILQCISRQCNVVVFVSIATQIKTGIYKCIVEWIDRWGYRRYLTASNKDRLEISCNRHRSTMFFKYGNSNPESSAKSIEGMDLAIVDEGQLFVPRFFTFLQGTMREKNVRTIITCNLSRPETWVYRMARGGEMEDLNESYYLHTLKPYFLDRGIKPPYKQFIGRLYMPWYLNPYLSNESRGKIMSFAKSKSMVQREEYYIEYMNEVRTKSNLLVYPLGCFVPKRFEIEYDYMGRPMFERQYIKFLYGWDFGSTSNGAIVQVFIHSYEGHDKFGKPTLLRDLYIRKVICKPMPKMTEYLYRAMDWIPEIFNEDSESEINTYIDDRGETDENSEKVMQLRTGFYGYPTVKAASAKKGAGSIYDRVMFIKSFNQVYYHIECEKCFNIPGRLHCDNIYHELINYRYEINKETDSIKYVDGKEKIEDKNNHIMDAIGYSIQGVREQIVSPYRDTPQDELMLLHEMGTQQSGVYFNID